MTKLTVEELEAYSQQQEISHNNDVHELRKKYVKKIYRLIKKYLIVLAVFIAIQAVCKVFNVAFGAAVIIAVLTTTTMNVLGIFYIVTHWLFPNPKNHH